MKQFLKIFKFELKNYFVNKVFVGITLFLAVVIAVVMDTFFGVLRAIKHRCFNSSVGIDGAIRKKK